MIEGNRFHIAGRYLIEIALNQIQSYTLDALSNKTVASKLQLINVGKTCTTRSVLD